MIFKSFLSQLAIIIMKETDVLPERYFFPLAVLWHHLHPTLDTIFKTKSAFACQLFAAIVFLSASVIN